MIEQKIESKIAELVTNALSGLNIQVMSAWSPTPAGTLKGLEDGTASGIATIRATPRNYATPTIPTAQIGVTINLIMRVDTDACGADYLSACDALMGAL